ncbi:MAG: hypothetical protein V7637_4028 [Mycobacteriales bacterium]
MRLAARWVGLGGVVDVAWPSLYAAYSLASASASVRLMGGRDMAKPTPSAVSPSRSAPQRWFQYRRIAPCSDGAAVVVAAAVVQRLVDRPSLNDRQRRDDDPAGSGRPGRIRTEAVIPPLVPVGDLLAPVCRGRTGDCPRRQHRLAVQGLDRHRRYARRTGAHPLPRRHIGPQQPPRWSIGHPGTPSKIADVRYPAAQAGDQVAPGRPDQRTTRRQVGRISTSCSPVPASCGIDRSVKTSEPRLTRADRRLRHAVNRPETALNSLVPQCWPTHGCRVTSDVA